MASKIIPAPVVQTQAESAANEIRKAALGVNRHCSAFVEITTNRLFGVAYLEARHLTTEEVLAELGDEAKDLLALLEAAKAIVNLHGVGGDATKAQSLHVPDGKSLKDNGDGTLTFVDAAKEA